MNSRERILAIVIGLGLGVVVLYNVVSFFFVTPYREAKQKIIDLAAEEQRIDGIVGTRKYLATDWIKFASQTFSHEKTKALDRFGTDLKEIAKRHGFEGALFTSGSETRIGARTGISTVSHRIGVSGPFKNVVAFLRDVYETPYLSQITRLNISPMDAKAGRNLVKAEFIAETPVLPQIDVKKVPEVAISETMPLNPDKPLPRARKHVSGDEAFALLGERNIFREYQPPPTNVVMVDNQDWKTVSVRVRYYWDERVQEEQVKTLASKSNLSLSGKGDVVEIEGTYADNVPFGPKRLDFSTKKDWAYIINVHHDPPPPEVIDLAVDNQHDAAVYVEVALTPKDGPEQAEPVMVFEPGRADVRQYKDVQSLKVTARYSSGERSASKTFTPSASKQTYIVPQESAAVAEAEPEPIEDPPADAAWTVTGLLTYEGVQEMVATGATERRVIRTGDSAAVDGGVLLAVHPLGGIVKMPTGNYYFYPLGRRFTERVKLAAQSASDLSAAIDEWSRQ